MYILKKSIRFHSLVMMIKKLQTFDKITTYPYGTNSFKVCESEMLSKYKWLILMITQKKITQNLI